MTVFDNTERNPTQPARHGTIRHRHIATRRTTAPHQNTTVLHRHNILPDATLPHQNGTQHDNTATLRDRTTHHITATAHHVTQPNKTLPLLYTHILLIEALKRHSITGNRCVLIKINPRPDGRGLSKDCKGF